MHTFRDKAGGEWVVEITVATVKRVKGLAGVDLLAIGDEAENLLQRLATDPVALVDVLYAVCHPQITERGLDGDGFADLFSGDSIEAAAAALLEELIGFFQNPRDRAIMTAALGKTRAAMDLARTRIEDKIASGAIEAEVESRLARLGLSSTDSPAPPASTPTP